MEHSKSPAQKREIEERRLYDREQMIIRRCMWTVLVTTLTVFSMFGLQVWLRDVKTPIVGNIILTITGIAMIVSTIAIIIWSAIGYMRFGRFVSQK